MTLPGPVRRCTLLALLLAAAPVSAAESFDELVRRLPPGGNALLLLDADALRRSPVGKRADWAANHERTALGDAVSLPPAVERLVVAAQLSPTTLEHVWKIGLAATRAPVTADDLARGEGGRADTVAGKPVVLSPRNAYYVPLAPQVVGAMHPANRQAVGRWVRAAPGGAPSLSPYLQDAAGNARTPILLAIDTTDAFDPPGLRDRLAKSKALATQSSAVDRVTLALSGLKGVRLAVLAGEKLEGELRLDVSAPDALAPFAKALVLEALDAMSAAVDDLEDWTVRTSGPTVVLSGPLSERGLRQLLSPLLSPAMTAAPAPPPGGPRSAGPAKPTAAASQKYFRAVTRLLNDLKGQKPKTYNNMAQSYQQYAQQIDELPLLGVDEELLKWGADVAVTLRSLATLAKSTQSQKNIIAMNRADVPVQSSGSYNTADAWGYQYSVPTSTTYNVSNVGQVNNMMATAGASESATRSQTWNNIDKATADVRRKMVAKYQVEF
jgi:hypothetical protein